MKRNTCTFALILSTLCFALLGNGCSESGGGILGPEQIAISDIPDGAEQNPFRNPGSPAELSASWSSGGVQLSWSCDCPAVIFYRIYRQVDGATATIVRATSLSSATDDLRYVDYQKVVYFVTGVDAYGNESDPSNRVGMKKTAAKSPNAKSVGADSQQP